MYLDKNPDFSGYATKNNIKCTDGRTIMNGAFKHQDKKKVPLVWRHNHSDPDTILGYAVLEHREGKGTYTYAYFNDTAQGQNARQLVEHGDVESLSIYATNLTEQNKSVYHGDIKEVSLVLFGANPGAQIENVYIRHDDGDYSEIEGEAIITTGEAIQHETMEEEIEMKEEKEEELLHEAGDKTVADVFNEFTEEQKNVVYFMIGEAINEAEGQTMQQSDIIDEGKILQHIQEGFDNMTNVFEEQGKSSVSHEDRPKLSPEQLKQLMTDAKRTGSLKEAFIAHMDEYGALAHAGVAGVDYGITDIDFLFPDARTLSNSPELISRRMEWVTNVLANTKHSPFSRIKSLQADVTADEARAKGYVKGNYKKDEIIKMLRRTTTPKTIYKKQKLDHDDINDITDLDVVAWLKAEMRIMLDEEIARAILVGDGRESDDEDKIDEDHIRPIAYDIDMYAHAVTLDGTPTPSETIEAIVRSRRFYKGTGQPTLYTTEEHLTDLILDKDTLGRRFYATEAELAAALRVKDIVTVEPMESTADIWGVIVNLSDYTIGADKGGAISMFEDFDIDYNQEKYLIETRISGALTKVKSAIVIKYNPGTVVDPITAPTFVNSTGVVTIPTQVGVIYKNDETGDVLTAGAQTALVVGDTLEVQAVPASGYSFAHGVDADWAFTRI